EGARTNIAFLQALLKSPALAAGELHTRYVEEHAAELLQDAGDRARYFEPAGTQQRRAGTRVDPLDPLAVLDLRPGAGAGAHGLADAGPRADVPAGPEGTLAVPAPMQGTVISIAVAEGDPVLPGQPVAVMEALKMEHVVLATAAGVVREIALEAGETIFE